MAIGLSIPGFFFLLFICFSLSFFPNNPYIIFSSKGVIFHIFLGFILSTIFFFYFLEKEMTMNGKTKGEEGVIFDVLLFFIFCFCF